MMSGLKDRLLGAFNLFRSQSDVTEAGRAFDFKIYDDNISQLFAKNGIVNVRHVGGTFFIPEELRSRYKSGREHAQHFEVATVALADHKDGRSSAYMAGWRHDGGGYEIISLHNIGMPENINSATDRIQARIYAHLSREVLSSSAVLLRAEQQNGFYPEKFLNQTSPPLQANGIGLEAA